MEKRLLLVTGIPGVGKTTVLLKAVDGLRVKHYRIGGMISRDVRSGGSRIGFEVLDLISGRSGWLATVAQDHGPSVGRYRVNLEDLDNVGAKAIMQAVDQSDVIVIDEIGPMELFSQQFKHAVMKTLESNKPAICIVHWKMKNELIDGMKRRDDAETFTATPENRDHLHELLVQKVMHLTVHKDTDKEL